MRISHPSFHVFWLAIFCLVCVTACRESDDVTPVNTIAPTLTPIINNPSPNLKQGLDCFDLSFESPIGVAIGNRGRVTLRDHNLEVQMEPFGTVVGDMQPLETFAILRGPVCWSPPLPTSNSGMKQTERLWYVQSEASGVEGWITEYNATTIRTTYFIEPIDENQPNIALAAPLSTSLTFAGTFDGNSGVSESHSVTFENYGYITIDFQLWAADDTEIDINDYYCPILLPSGTGRSTTSERGPFQTHGNSLHSIFVEPGEYTFQFSVPYTDSTPFPYDCPTAPYTVTFASAPAE